MSAPTLLTCGHCGLKGDKLGCVNYACIGYWMAVAQQQAIRYEARVAELEAELSRAKPVVNAAVKERAAADYYDETDDDAHEGDSRRRWTLAQAELSEKVASYLAATPKEPR